MMNLEVPVIGIQSKIMHLMNEVEFDCMFVNSNVRNKGCFVSLRVSWASYDDHAVTCKHGSHTIRHHDRMPFMQNIIANEAGLKSRLEKTGLIVGRKDRPADVLLPMFYAGQDACLDSVITHLLQPTFIDRAAGKSLVAAKAAVAKKHSDDDEKCHRNGLRLIAMAWETFNGPAPKTRFMIRKIVIRHADKHNRPRGQTIYQIN